MENTLAGRGGEKNRRRQFPADSTRFFPYLSRKVRGVVVGSGGGGGGGWCALCSFVPSLSEARRPGRNAHIRPKVGLP